MALEDFQQGSTCHDKAEQYHPGDQTEKVEVGRAHTAKREGSSGKSGTTMDTGRSKKEGTTQNYLAEDPRGRSSEPRQVVE